MVGEGDPFDERIQVGRIGHGDQITACRVHGDSHVEIHHSIRVTDICDGSGFRHPVMMGPCTASRPEMGRSEGDVPEEHIVKRSSAVPDADCTCGAALSHLDRGIRYRQRTVGIRSDDKCPLIC